jgi:hypothetical protein
MRTRLIADVAPRQRIGGAHTVSIDERIDTPIGRRKNLMTFPEKSGNCSCAIQCRCYLLRHE